MNPFTHKFSSSGQCFHIPLLECVFRHIIKFSGSGLLVFPAGIHMFYNLLTAEKSSMTLTFMIRISENKKSHSTKYHNLKRKEHMPSDQNAEFT